MSAQQAWIDGGSPARASDGSQPRAAGVVDELVVARARNAVMDLRACLAELGGVDPEVLGGRVQMALSTELATAIGKLTAIRADVLAVIDESGAWRGQGSRTLEDVERKTSGATKAESSRTIKRAKTLRKELPKFREEVHAGGISMAHVDAINHVATTPELKAQLADPEEGEALLLDAAKTMDPDRFRKHVKAWVIKHEPEQAEEQARRESLEEELMMIERGWGWALNGKFGPVNGHLVNTVLSAQMGVPTANDLRGPKQRRADALVALCSRAAEYGDIKKSALITPHVSVHVPLETMVGAEMAAQISAEHANSKRVVDKPKDGAKKSSCAHSSQTLGRILATISSGYSSDVFEGLEPATFDDGTPLVPSQLQALLCNSELARIIFGAKGQVLDAGRASRIVTKNQIRAVVARDKTCRFPGCDQTISSSQVHHAQYWRDGGPTNIDNLVMLCWYHHTYVHQHDITITHHEHGWVFRKPNGRILAGPRPHGEKPPDARGGTSPP